MICFMTFHSNHLINYFFIFTYFHFLYFSVYFAFISCPRGQSVLYYYPPHLAPTWSASQSLPSRMTSSFHYSKSANNFSNPVPVKKGQRDGQDSVKQRTPSPVSVADFSHSPSQSQSQSYYSAAAGLSNPHTSNSNFYNLQMYQDTDAFAFPSHQAQPTDYANFNLYQSVQEVPYHSSSRIYSEVNSDSRNNSVRSLCDRHSTSASTSASANHFTTLTTSTVSPYQPVLNPIYATFGTESIFVTCPYCHHNDTTEVDLAFGSDALLWACIIPFFGFLRKSKWETRHRCKNCLNVIGIHYP